MLRIKDSMAIEDGEGNNIAEVKKALITPLRDRWTVKIRNGPDLDVQGNILDHEYEIIEGSRKIAQISKKWFWVRDTYGVEIAPGLKSTIVFLVFAALWVLGQGMHLSANTIGHWLSEVAGDQVYDVTYFYDEVLSHYLWHLGAAALSAQLIYNSWKRPFEDQTAHLISETVAGIIYGLTIFMIGIEGGTVAILFPFSALAGIAALILGWGKFKHMPVLSFFMVGYALAALIFIGWGLYWVGFPQFSHLGWI